MVFFQLFHVVAVFVMFNAVLSTTHRNIKKSFTLHQSPKSYIKSGPAHMLSAYQRLNAAAPEDLKSAVSVNNGTISASPLAFGAGYLTPITIGEQTFDVEIDTGSHLLWVFSSKLPSTKHNSYNPSLSPTSRIQQGRAWKKCYGGGDLRCAIGEYYIEDVSVGGITFTNQIIGAVMNITAAFPQPAGFEGLFGLAIGGANPTFFENVKSSLSAPLFTADLKKGRPGSFDFGFINDSKYYGNITYVPVDTSRGYWGFDVNGYAIGDDNINLLSINVVADTGTSIVFLPLQIVDAYYSGVPEASYNSNEFGYVFPCGTALPDFTFVIGGYKAVVPGSFFEYRASGIICYGGIQSLGDLTIPVFILGDVFLKSQFVVFDGENDGPRLGFAAKSLY